MQSNPFSLNRLQRFIWAMVEPPGLDQPEIILIFEDITMIIYFIIPENQTQKNSLLRGLTFGKGGVN